MLHSRFNVFGVWVENIQIFFILCEILLQRNFVNFRFRIVIIVKRLERWWCIKVVYVSGRKSFCFICWWKWDNFHEMIFFLFVKNSPPSTTNTKKMHKKLTTKRKNIDMFSRSHPWAQKWHKTQLLTQQEIKGKFEKSHNILNESQRHVQFSQTKENFSFSLR